MGNKKFKENHIYIEDGKEWTDWVFPRMSRYELGCCDCCLYHTVQFRIYKGNKIMSIKNYEVSFRVKRNNKLTKEIRKKEHIKMRIK